MELALRTTLDENLMMIADTVRHLREEGQRVFLDAEHFFDGYQSNPAYALECVRAAAEAGASVIALCDTNGGMMPTELGDIVHAVASATGARLGIHCHDDTGCGVANTLVAVEAGVTHVQGTANGYGERAGNANLFSVVAGLQLKKGKVVLDGEGIREMTRIAHAISEVTNVTPDTHQPYVGLSAFAHKAGLHASAIRVDPMLYQHIDPAAVGNDMRMLVSDMAGRASVELKGRELGFDLSGDKEVIGRVTDKVKSLEANGYSFEAADASFELLLRDELAGERRRHFTVESWRVIVEQREDGVVTSEATVRLEAKGERVVAVGEGNGPVNALDRALRAALEQTFPELASLELTDYKVRILEGSAGTGAITRVLIESSNARRRHLVNGRRGRERNLRLLARPGRGGHLRPAPRRPHPRITPETPPERPTNHRPGPSHSRTGSQGTPGSDGSRTRPPTRHLRATAAAPLPRQAHKAHLADPDHPPASASATDATDVGYKRPPGGPFVLYPTSLRSDPQPPTAQSGLIGRHRLARGDTSKPRVRTAMGRDDVTHGPVRRTNTQDPGAHQTAAGIP